MKTVFSDLQLNHRPTLFVIEGGDAIDALGINCVNVFSGFEGG